MNSKVTQRQTLHLLVLLVILTISAAFSRAQDSSGAAGQSNPPAEKTQGNPTETQNAKDNGEAKQEVAMQDTGATFKLRVNLVQVHVIVRDSAGKPVENLRKEDFLVYDSGKLQAISTFGIETAKSRKERAEAAAKTQTGEGETAGGGSVMLPERFVAMTFDDIHLKMADAVSVRVAAGRFVDAMTPGDRIGIFSTSGQLTQDFTSDKEALKQKLLGLMPRGAMGGHISDCPDVSHYMADQIENKHDPQALAVVIQETLQCMFGGDQRMLGAAQTAAQSAAMMALNAGDADNNFTYRQLEVVLRALAAKPGERVLLLASPGFLITEDQLDAPGIVDRANRANIVINALDARGLYAPEPGGDISQHNSDTPVTAGYKATYRIAEQSEEQFVLMDMAYGTGGTFFHNSNDLEGGLKLAGGVPEVSYVLGYSPQNQKIDGKYHTIKVTLAGKQKYAIQARRGYYAPKKLNDPQETEKQEIQEALFSQDEIHDLPLSLQTQYFKTGDTDARLSVVSHLELAGMRFRKAEGRNLDNLTVATAVFDENGNFITGGEKLVKMRLFDATLEKLRRTGLTVKSSFQVKPGRYMVRQVVRDSEGAQMAARNGTVVIAY
ncbi:MAG TPA: VWA domain-containing protein [Candidatus Acidoferrum sp.]|nr:VWA domain-containing protein [Candidatus Acidoferrum sp.]